MHTCKRHEWADEQMACPLCFEEKPELSSKERRAIGRLLLAEPRRERRQAGVATEYKPVNMVVVPAPIVQPEMSVSLTMLQPDSEASIARRFAYARQMVTSGQLQGVRT
jgi:hypothetical protein